MLLWFAWGCEAPDRDRDGYLAALRSPDLAVAAKACDGLESASLRGDCRNDVAERRAAAGDFAGATIVCERVNHAVWRDECWFLITDRAALRGMPALEACKEAGRFRDHCVAHALTREVSDLSARFPEGREAELQVAIAGLLSAYGIADDAPTHGARSPAAQLLALVLAGRFDQQPFEAARCGAVPAADCDLAYFESVRAAGARVDLAALCASGPGLDDVRAAGLPGWTDAGATAANQVWFGLCEALAAGRLQPVANVWIGPD